MATHVLILVEVSDEFEDPDHEMGLTEDAYLKQEVSYGEVIDGPVKVEADNIHDAALEARQ